MQVFRRPLGDFFLEVHKNRNRTVLCYTQNEEGDHAL